MIWHLIKYLITFILPSFYRRIQGRNVKNLLTKGPAILAMNHPNAFTDPIVFTYVTYPVRPKYLARGDAFKPGIVSFLLEQIGIVPIFRIQDAGKEGLKKNDETYIRVNELLKKNNKIIVFAEGLCIQERRLRPLKKGVARMVFGAYEYLKNDQLVVIPVGVNYSQPDKFGSTLFYNVGDPIPVKDFYAEYQKSPAKANNLFLQQLEPKMKELITHVNNPKNDEVIIFLEMLMKKDLLKEQKLNRRNLYHDYLVTKHLTEKLNASEAEHQPLIDEFKVKAKNYVRELRKNGMRDWLINPKQNKRVNAMNVFLRSFVILALSPLYLLSFILYFPVYKLSHLIVKKVLRANTEFYSSFFIGVAMVLFWLSISLWLFIVHFFISGFPYLFLIFIFFLMTGWFGLRFHVFILKTMGMLRAVKNRSKQRQLMDLREELMRMINKFL